MSNYFAQLDSSNTVTDVIVADPSFISGLSNVASFVETSISGAYRKQYAGIGYSYDVTGDVFVLPAPAPIIGSGWQLNDTYDWVPYSLLS